MISAGNKVEYSRGYSKISTDILKVIKNIAEGPFFVELSQSMLIDVVANHG